PARLVTRADAAPILTVKVLVEQHQLSEVRIFGVAALVTVARSLAVRTRQKEARKAPCQLGRDLLQIHPHARAGGVLHLQRISIVMVVTLERFDDQVVEWEPDWPAPVRIAAEKPSGGIAGRVLDAMLHLTRKEPERRVAVHSTERAEPVR